MSYLVSSGLKAQHRNSYLGYLWWLLDPLLGVGIYYFLVVIVLKKASVENYGAFLVVGLIAWRWLSSSVASASKSIASQAGIVSKVYLPKAIFPICSSITQLINFFFGLILIAAYLIYSKTPPGINVLWLPYVIFVQLMFQLALSLVIAYVSVFIKDIDNAISHIIRLWFYATPVIWDASFLKNHMWVLTYNPMSTILTSYRNILLYNEGPALLKLSVIGAGSLLLVVFFVYYYSHNEHKIIKVL